SHPELLTLLADEFAAHQFDIKFLLRELALSKTYQRSSELPEGVKEMAPERFAAAHLKPLTPEQFAWGLMQATWLTEPEPTPLGAKATSDTRHARLASNVAPFVTIFGGQPGQPQEQGFQTTLDQTLFLTNGPLVRGWLAPRPGNLADRLGQLAAPEAVA